MGLPCFLSAQTSDWITSRTSQVGLDSSTAFGLYVTDINNDHYPDLVAVHGGWATTTENTLRVYLNVQDTSPGNRGGRMFVDVTEASGVNANAAPTEVSRGVSLVVMGDLNNDGNVDIIRGNYYHRLKYYEDHGDRCEVLLGDGQGHFKLVSNKPSEDRVNAEYYPFYRTRPRPLQTCDRKTLTLKNA